MPETFAHGGNIYAFAKHLGVAPEEVIDFSSNINFLQPAYMLDSVHIAPYPDPEYHHLKQSVAAYLNVSPVSLEPFNGASSAIFSLLQYLKTDSVTLYAPIYSEYKRACEFLDIPVHLINRFEGVSDPEPGSTLVFVNPSTPDGRLYEMAPLLDRWRAVGSRVIIDESFLDFTEADSVASYLQEWKNLYIIRSFTKFFACAGVRVGFVLSHSENIAGLRQQEPLWKVSALDSAYLTQALENREFQKQSQTANRENRAQLKKILDDSPLFETVYDSEANFLLARLQTMNAEHLQKKLAPFHILIRDCGNFDFLDEHYVRFAVKDSDSIEKLEHALKAIL